MGKLTFGCGCSFPVDGCETEILADFHDGPLPLGIDVDIYNIPHTCPRTWGLFAQGHTKGVFQLEGHLGKTWAMKIEPSNMEELGALVALLRPGCLKAKNKPAVKFLATISIDITDDFGNVRHVIVNRDDRFEIEKHRHNNNNDTVKIKFPGDSPLAGETVINQEDCIIYPSKSMTEHYRDRKHLVEDVEYLHPILEPILGSTYGVLTYQEQSMRIAVTLAGFDLQQADILRKAIGKKKPEIMAKVRGDFMGGCTNTGIVEPVVAEEIFGWIQESQRYSFNKSHAISYGEGGYWTAYLKAHFPVQFYCSYLEGAQWKQDTAEEVTEIVNDAKIQEVDICVPDFRDQQEIPYIKGVSVYFGLGDIKKIGAAALKKLKLAVLEAEDTLGKKVKDWTWLDYLIVFSPGVSITTNEAVISCGALDYLKKSRTSMLYELKLLGQLTKKELEWLQTQNSENPFPNFLAALNACARIKKEGGGCFNVKRVKIVSDLATILRNPPHSMYDTADFIAWSEESYLGTDLSCSKVDACEKAVEANATCLDVVRGLAGTSYTVLAVEVVRAKETKTKKGKNPGSKMAFLSLKDSTCMLSDVVAFPEPWKEYGNLLYEGNTILVQGSKGNKKGDSFAVKKVWQI